MNNRHSGNVPVREGDEMTVSIEAVGEKGDGIAKKDGFVIFIPETQVNDMVKIRITRVLSKQAFGEVIGKGDASEVSSPSGDAPADMTAEGEDSENFGENDERA